MAEIICPTCKAKNRGTAQYCAECGSPLLTGLKPDPAGRKTSAQPPSAEQLPEQPASTRWVLQNRYEMGEALGRGGFGSVYKAIDTNLNRICAIKENLATSEESQRQFMREATVLANLSHPNLPRVTDHFIVPDQGQYLVMDFVEGDDLEKMLEKREIVPLDEALEWVIQVAGALEYLHNQEPPVFHRDIKPANIRITPRGKAMLVDFGLVKVYEERLKTTAGARAITPGFAPPEQYGRGGTDGRTDIYALGATLYNMVTGHEPLESVRRMAGEHMSSAHALNPGVPLRLSDAIERAMDLDPMKRYQHVAEFLIELQAAKAALEQADKAEPLATVVLTPEMDAPDPAKTAANLPGLPVPPTQMTGSSEAFPATVAVEQPRPPSEAHVSKPAGSQRNWLLVGAGVAVLALLCLALFGGGMFALFYKGRGDPVQKTLTAHARLNAPVEKTLTARSGSGITLTSTDTPDKPTLEPESAATRRAEQDATATRDALRAEQTKEAATQVAGQTATAESAASATGAAIPAELAAFDQSAVKKYGPRSGNLVHKADDYIDSLDSGVSLRNFITEVIFEVPYSTSSGAWDFGIIFRHYQANNQANTQFRFYVLSDKRFQITRTVGSPDGEVLAEGTIDNLKTDKGDQNKIRLYVIEGDGWLFVNDEFITKFDASKHYTGGIIIGVDFVRGAVMSGAITPYKDWTIWSVPAQP